MRAANLGMSASRNLLLRRHFLVQRSYRHFANDIIRRRLVAEVDDLARLLVS